MTVAINTTLPCGTLQCDNLKRPTIFATWNCTTFSKDCIASTLHYLSVFLKLEEGETEVDRKNLILQTVHVIINANAMFCHVSAGSFPLQTTALQKVSALEALVDHGFLNIRMRISGTTPSCHLRAHSPTRLIYRVRFTVPLGSGSMMAPSGIRITPLRSAPR